MMTRSSTLLLSIAISGFAIAETPIQVTTLDSLPGKNCRVVGALPGVVHREIRQQLAGNPVTVATAEAVKGMQDLAGKQGANAVLGIQITMIPLDRNKGREFGDVVLLGTFAQCD